MIWVNHNLFSNLTGSVASGDTDMTLSIFKSELSDLIVYNIDKLFELFDKVDIKYKKSYSDEEIIEIVLKEMNTNAKFLRGISFLIAENNDVIKENKGLSWKKVLDRITNAVRKINTIFINDPLAKQLFEKQTLEMIITKANKVGNRERTIKKKNYTAAWIIGILVVGVGSYLLYEYMRKKRIEKALQNNVSKMELGGQTGTATPNDVPNPNSPNTATTQVNAPNTAVANTQVAPVAAPKPTYDPTDPAFNVGQDVLMPAPQPQTTVVVNTAQPQTVPPINQTIKSS